MAGNVWEWCSTLWQKVYPFKIEDEWLENYLKQSGLRVLRGGAFIGNQNCARCAYRDGGFPFDGYSHIGFRLVVLPISPASVP